MKILNEHNILTYIGFTLAFVVWVYIIFAFVLALFSGGSAL